MQSMQQQSQFTPYFKKNHIKGKSSVILTNESVVSKGAATRRSKIFWYLFHSVFWATTIGLPLRS
jgi:hypothetical protein